MSASLRAWILLGGLWYPLLAQQGSVPATAATQSEPQTSPAPQLQRHGSENTANPNRRAALGNSNPRLTLDVVVTDAAGNPVRGLQSEDFTVLDNKKPPSLVSFHAATPATTRIDTSVEILLVVDAINTSYANVTIAEDQIKAFLRRNRGHLAWPVSIAFVSDAEPRMKDGRASDPGSTMALQRREAFVHRIPPSQDGTLLIKALDMSGPSLHRILEAQGKQGQSERVRLSLVALSFIATAEAAKPGRKILIYISPGWPLMAESNTKTQEQLFDSVLYFSDALRDARITLYNINPEGVGVGPQLTLGISDPGVIKQGSMIGMPRPQADVGPVYYESFYKGASTAKQANINDLALQVLAFQSGGLVIAGNNDIEKQIARCAADANAFYVLSYDFPASKSLDEYHDLEVKIAKPGLVARSRTGFYVR
jgi:VWFA-related protein